MDVGVRLVCRQVVSLEVGGVIGDAQLAPAIRRRLSVCPLCAVRIRCAHLVGVGVDVESVDGCVKVFGRSPCVCLGLGGVRTSGEKGFWPL